MKRNLAPIALTLLLAACAPMSIYYRPGAPVAQMEKDTTLCEIQALKQAPVATQIRQMPPVYVPGRRVCDAQGNCWVRPGFWRQGEIYTVDANASLRARAKSLCMAEKGYSPVSLPPCPPEVKSATPPGVTTVLPQLTQNACVIRNKGGSWQIVTR
ncbi:hypothetical protein [Pseudodonghicola flavimaris]|uniref:Lipoprotein n=1 Tax=Pseudodonghicola flavimaris TaxID=3050036 RepID=A0ABT7EVB3_9RHOB|nr:hypothetical protein [Pseudodonghicola flavimaris]MDK3016276.1 hypothetical protein [Pseudodonghicola flavimaris]